MSARLEITVSGVLLAAVSALASCSLAGCGRREAVPAFHANDARFGRLRGNAEPPTKAAMCGHWTRSVLLRDEHAITHVSFPETNVQDACFTPVIHQARQITPGPAPPGCAYPDPGARQQLATLADRLERLPDTAPDPLFPCALTTLQRAAARRHNVRTLRALARSERTFPYAATLIPGHGVPEQNETALARFLPDEDCSALRDGDLGRLGVLPIRTARAADALRGGVAPVAIVSGGAVHSRVIEAFAMTQLLRCREHIPAERILVEPCAEHTHTNLRNGGRWIHAMGGRAAYLLTDDFIQSEYFQDTSGFELLMGTVDQRSLRDWGFLLGAWRQASVGSKAGFWFTPYRFWAEARDGLGSVTCVDEP